MTDEKAKTVDGAPIGRDALNVNSSEVLASAKTGPLARLARIYSRLNEIMSGMYTGVGCAGTPHEHHSYTKTPKRKAEND